MLVDMKSQAYLSVTISVLATFEIPQSQSAITYNMPYTDDVREFMIVILPQPANIFADDYFSRLSYLVKVFLEVKLYSFESVSPAFLLELKFSDYQGIMNHVCFPSSSTIQIQQLRHL